MPSLPQRSFGYFIPRRYNDTKDPVDLSSLEVLLVRRPLDGPPDESGYHGYDYPGEWMFPGGHLKLDLVYRKKEQDDVDFPTLLGPSVYYLYRQLALTRSTTVAWNTVYQFPSFDEERYAEFRINTFFTGVLVNFPEEQQPGGFEHRWFTPQEAYALLTSDAFTAEQNQEIQARGLWHPKYGIRATRQRVFSPSTHRILRSLTREDRFAISLDGSEQFKI